MTLNDAQIQVDEYVSQFKMGYWSPLSNLARLIEEVGELARELNHLFGDKPKKSSEKIANMKEEMGDILFTLICIANSQSVNLQECLDEVIAKYNHRDRNRWERKN